MLNDINELACALAALSVGQILDWSLFLAVGICFLAFMPI